MSGIPLIRTWLWSAIKDIFLVILSTYFWATKSGSKKSVVILWAYMEHAVREQRPAERNKRICAANSNLNQSRRSWWCDLVEHLIHSKCYIPSESRHRHICSVGFLPFRMKWKPERTVRRALVVSEPPIFVHFIPTKERMAPKKPRHTEAIIRPLHTWI